MLLDHNDSERFECRFVTVRVSDSPAIMFTGMTDTVFGMWSAHGEGMKRYSTVYEHAAEHYSLAPRL